MRGRYKLKHREQGGAELSIKGSSVWFWRPESEPQVDSCQNLKSAEAALNTKLEALYQQGWEIEDIVTESSEALEVESRRQEIRETKPSTTEMIRNAICSRDGDVVVIDVEAAVASPKQIGEVWRHVAGGQPRSVWLMGALEPSRGYMRTLQPWCAALKKEELSSLQTLVVAGRGQREPGVNVGNMAALLTQFPMLQRLHLEGDGSFAGFQHESLETACWFGAGGKGLRDLLTSECPHLKVLALAAHFTSAMDDQALAEAWPPLGLPSLRTLVIGWPVDPLPILRAVADKTGPTSFESLRIVARSVTYPLDHLSWSDTLRWLDAHHPQLSHLKEVGLPSSLAFKPDPFDPVESTLVERLHARMSNLVDTDRDTSFSLEHRQSSVLSRRGVQ